MNKLAVLFPVAVLGLSTIASAYDDDPDLLFGRGWYGGRQMDHSSALQRNTPLYYRPTQRYYGSGYTISYRYIPVYRTDSASSVAVNGATNFRTEAFHIETEQIPAWGINPPRLVVKDPKSGTPRSAVTTIVRKKTTTKTSAKSPEPAAPVETPAIIPGAPDASAATPATAAPVPVPTEALAKP